MPAWLARVQHAGRLEKVVRTLAALGIVAIGLLVGQIGVLALIGMLPLLLLVGGWRRRPRLTLQTRGVDADGTISGPRERWPVSAERIVANERARLVESIEPHEKLSKTLGAMYGFGSRPASEQAYQEARRAFLAQVDVYCDDLRAWLDEYESASTTEETMFHLRFSVRNGENWTSHAEGVRLELELPAGVRRVDHELSVTAPPEAPSYEPPPHQPGFATVAGYTGRHLDRLVPVPATVPDLSGLLKPARQRQRLRQVWSERDAGSFVSADVGEVYVGGTEEIDEELVLQVVEREVTLGWRLFFKDGSRRGTLTMRRPEPRRPVPAFGRLAGLLRYPDVTIRNDDGEIVHTKRTSDPPLTAPTSCDERSHDLSDRLHAIGAFTQWQELGLDPNHDGESAVVRVDEAEL
jgi:hypothetical protein